VVAVAFQAQRNPLNRAGKTDNFAKGIWLVDQVTHKYQLTISSSADATEHKKG